MKKIFILFLGFLFMSKICFSAPSNTMSLQYDPSPNTIINSSSYKSEENHQITQYNSHSHTDITGLGTVTSGTWQGSIITVPYGGTGVASVTANSYLKGNGTSALVERTYAQVKTDLSLSNVENTALSTWAGTSNIITLGTITTGTWNGTAIGTIYGGTGLATSMIKIVSYTGNGADNRNIAHGLGVTPNIVCISSDSIAQGSMWFVTGYTAGNSVDFSNGTVSTTAIKSVDGTNVQIGTDPNANGNTRSYQMIVMKTN